MLERLKASARGYRVDGFETCRRLAESQAVGDVPLIFLTARDEPQDVEAGFRAGGVDYIAILERALMECEGGELREEHIHFFGSARRPAPTAGDPVAAPAGLRADPATEKTRILEQVRTHGSITNTEAQRVLECDRNHASYLLHRLMADRALLCEGHGRWARYRLRGCT